MTARPDQLHPAATFELTPRELELALLAGRCDLLLELAIPPATAQRSAARTIKEPTTNE